jgi:hypothetical protein
MFLILIICILSGFFISTTAQVKVTDGAVLTIDPNSLLEMESANKGLLIPRMAINNLNASSPLTAPVPEGMLVYSIGGSVPDGFYYWDGSQWKKFVQATIQVNEGGTGLTSFGGINAILYTSTTDVLSSVAQSTIAGQFLQTTTPGGAPTWKSILDVANGGTGSSAQNFVDLTSNQTIGGNKTFTGSISALNLSGSNTGDQTITLTGNVTGSGTGSFAATIADNAVTYAKMQAVSTTSRLLGSSSTTTPVQEITLGSGLSLAGTTLSSTGSGGTVTNFSAGDLAPLFTTTEATTTTTPALSFSFTNAGGYSIFGNNAGSAAAPAYFTPVLASALFQNQGTATTVLHGNGAGSPSWAQIVNADITNGTIDLTTKVNGILASTNGGTGNGFTKFTGPITAEKTFTLPNASATILTTNSAVTVVQGGTGLTTFGGANTVLYTTAANALSSVAASSAAGQFLQTNASGGAPSWKTILAIANGGTGSATQNFVDLTTAQNIGGAKTFTAAISASNLSGTNTGDQTITLTGNVTGSGTGSFAATIANNAVTYTKMQAVSTTSRLLGSSSTTTPVQEITLGTGLSMAGTTINAAASTFSNPSATIGLTAINGSASTAMRSDAAPALSQAIVPTWTGAHTWSALGTFNLGLSASGATVDLNNNSNFNTNINTGSSGTVSIGSTTGAASITQRVGTGNFSLDGVGASTYTIAPSTTTGTIAVGGTAQTGTITVGSSTAAQTLNLGTGSGASTINIGTGATAVTINIATGDAAGTIKIGDNTGTTSSSVQIGGATTINGAINLCIDNSVAGNDTYTATNTNITNLVTGLVVLFNAKTNNNNACTLNLNGTGAINITNQDGSNPANGDLRAGGYQFLVYTGSTWILIGRN